jgi:hypothetical protein
LTNLAVSAIVSKFKNLTMLDENGASVPLLNMTASDAIYLMIGSHWKAEKAADGETSIAEITIGDLSAQPDLSGQTLRQVFQGLLASSLRDASPSLSSQSASQIAATVLNEISYKSNTGVSLLDQTLGTIQQEAATPGFTDSLGTSLTSQSLLSLLDNAIFKQGNGQAVHDIYQMAFDGQLKGFPTFTSGGSAAKTIPFASSSLADLAWYALYNPARSYTDAAGHSQSSPTLSQLVSATLQDTFVNYDQARDIHSKVSDIQYDSMDREIASTEQRSWTSVGGGSIDGLDSSWTNGNVTVQTGKAYQGNTNRLAALSHDIHGTGTNSNAALGNTISAEYLQGSISYDDQGREQFWRAAQTQQGTYDYSYIHSGLFSKHENTIYNVTALLTTVSVNQVLSFDSLGRATSSSMTSRRDDANRTLTSELTTNITYNSDGTQNTSHSTANSTIFRNGQDSPGGQGAISGPWTHPWTGVARASELQAAYDALGSDRNPRGSATRADNIYKYDAFGNVDTKATEAASPSVTEMTVNNGVGGTIFGIVFNVLISVIEAVISYIPITKPFAPLINFVLETGRQSAMGVKIGRALQSAGETAAISAAGNAAGQAAGQIAKAVGETVSTAATIAVSASVVATIIATAVVGVVENQTGLLFRSLMAGVQELAGGWAATGLTLRTLAKAVTIALLNVGAASLEGVKDTGQLALIAGFSVLATFAAKESDLKNKSAGIQVLSGIETVVAGILTAVVVSQLIDRIVGNDFISQLGLTAFAAYTGQSAFSSSNSLSGGSTNSVSPASLFRIAFVAGLAEAKKSEITQQNRPHTLVIVRGPGAEPVDAQIQRQSRDFQEEEQSRIITATSIYGVISQELTPTSVTLSPDNAASPAARGLSQPSVALASSQDGNSAYAPASQATQDSRQKLGAVINAEASASESHAGEPQNILVRIAQTDTELSPSERKSAAAFLGAPLQSTLSPEQKVGLTFMQDSLAKQNISYDTILGAKINQQDVALFFKGDQLVAAGFVNAAGSKDVRTFLFTFKNGKVDTVTGNIHTEAGDFSFVFGMKGSQAYKQTMQTLGDHLAGSRLSYIKDSTNAIYTEKDKEGNVTRQVYLNTDSHGDATVVASEHRLADGSQRLLVYHAAQAGTDTKYRGEILEQSGKKGAYEPVGEFTIRQTAGDTGAVKLGKSLLEALGLGGHTRIIYDETIREGTHAGRRQISMDPATGRLQYVYSPDALNGKGRLVVFGQNIAVLQHAAPGVYIVDYHALSPTAKRDLMSSLPVMDKRDPSMLTSKLVGLQQAIVTARLAHAAPTLEKYGIKVDGDKLILPIGLLRGLPAGARAIQVLRIGQDEHQNPVYEGRLLMESPGGKGLEPSGFEVFISAASSGFSQALLRNAGVGADHISQSAKAGSETMTIVQRDKVLIETVTPGRKTESVSAPIDVLNQAVAKNLHERAPEAPKSAPPSPVKNNPRASPLRNLLPSSPPLQGPMSGPFRAEAPSEKPIKLADGPNTLMTGNETISGPRPEAPLDLVQAAFANSNNWSDRPTTPIGVAVLTSPDENLAVSNLHTSAFASVLDWAGNFFHAFSSVVRSIIIRAAQVLGFVPVTDETVSPVAAQKSTELGPKLSLSQDLTLADYALSGGMPRDPSPGRLLLSPGGSTLLTPVLSLIAPSLADVIGSQSEIGPSRGRQAELLSVVKEKTKIHDQYLVSSDLLQKTVESFRKNPSFTNPGQGSLDAEYKRHVIESLVIRVRGLKDREENLEQVSVALEKGDEETAHRLDRKGIGQLAAAQRGSMAAGLLANNAQARMELTHANVSAFEKGKEAIWEAASWLQNHPVLSAISSLMGLPQEAPAVVSVLLRSSHEEFSRRDASYASYRNDLHEAIRISDEGERLLAPNPVGRSSLTRALAARDVSSSLISGINLSASRETLARITYAPADLLHDAWNAIDKTSLTRSSALHFLTAIADGQAPATFTVIQKQSELLRSTVEESQAYFQGTALLWAVEKTKWDPGSSPIGKWFFDRWSAGSNTAVDRGISAIENDIFHRKNFDNLSLIPSLISSIELRTTAGRDVAIFTASVTLIAGSFVNMVINGERVVAQQVAKGLVEKESAGLLARVGMGEANSAFWNLAAKPGSTLLQMTTGGLLSVGLGEAGMLKAEHRMLNKSEFTEQFFEGALLAPLFEVISVPVKFSGGLTQPAANWMVEKGWLSATELGGSALRTSGMSLGTRFSLVGLGVLSTSQNLTAMWMMQSVGRPVAEAFINAAFSNSMPAGLRENVADYAGQAVGFTKLFRDLSPQQAFDHLSETRMEQKRVISILPEDMPLAENFIQRAAADDGGLPSKDWQIKIDMQSFRSASPENHELLMNWMDRAALVTVDKDERNLALVIESASARLQSDGVALGGAIAHNEMVIVQRTNEIQSQQQELHSIGEGNHHDGISETVLRQQKAAGTAGAADALADGRVAQLRDVEAKLPGNGGAFAERRLPIAGRDVPRAGETFGQDVGNPGQPEGRNSGVDAKSGDIGKVLQAERGAGAAERGAGAAERGEGAAERGAGRQAFERSEELRSSISSLESGRERVRVETEELRSLRGEIDRGIQQVHGAQLGYLATADYAREIVAARDAGTAAEPQSHKILLDSEWRQPDLPALAADRAMVRWAAERPVRLSWPVAVGTDVEVVLTKAEAAGKGAGFGERGTAYRIEVVPASGKDARQLYVTDLGNSGSRAGLQDFGIGRRVAPGIVKVESVEEVAQLINLQHGGSATELVRTSVLEQAIQQAESTSLLRRAQAKTFEGSIDLVVDLAGKTLDETQKQLLKGSATRAAVLIQKILGVSETEKLPFEKDPSATDPRGQWMSKVRELVGNERGALRIRSTPKPLAIGSPSTIIRKEPANFSKGLQTWEQFSQKYGSVYGNEVEARTAWGRYQDSNQPGHTLVIGRQPDTEAASDWPQHKRLKLLGDSWSKEVNDAWIQGGIDRKASFYLASDPSPENLVNKTRKAPTVFLRELQQLENAGYHRAGNYMIPPVKEETGL